MLKPIDNTELLARAEITQIVHRYAFMATENADFSAMPELFCDDGVFVLPTGDTVPASEIHRIVAGPGPEFIRHHVTTTDINFIDASNANVESLFIAYTDVAQPDHWGRWRDQFQRQDGGRWLLRSKEPVVEGYDPEGLWALALAQPR